MEEIVLLIMQRDGLDLQDAEILVYDIYRMIQRALHFSGFEAAERILQDELGLDPDYIWDFT